MYKEYISIHSAVVALGLGGTVHRQMHGTKTYRDKPGITALKALAKTNYLYLSIIYYIYLHEK